jgi:hypothetical protein
MPVCGDSFPRMVTARRDERTITIPKCLLFSPKEGLAIDQQIVEAIPCRSARWTDLLGTKKELVILDLYVGSYYNAFSVACEIKFVDVQGFDGPPAQP